MKTNTNTDNGVVQGHGTTYDSCRENSTETQIV